MSPVIVLSTMVAFKAEKNGSYIWIRFTGRPLKLTSA